MSALYGGASVGNGGGDDLSWEVDVIEFGLVVDVSTDTNCVVCVHLVVIEVLRVNILSEQDVFL